MPADLHVRDDDEWSFGLHSNGRSHALGLVEQPLFEILQPKIIDRDPLEIRTTGGGTLAPAGPPRAALGPGRYRFVPSTRRLLPTEDVLLGNDWVTAPANARHLFAGDGTTPVRRGLGYACVYGHDPARAPAPNGPLVGVTVLEYSGQPNLVGLLFFDCGLAGAPGFIVPLEGSMVIDNMSIFERTAEAAERWLEVADLFCAVLAVK